MKMKKLYLLFLLVLPLGLCAQQIPQFSQRAIDIFSYNPAFAGSKGYKELLIHHRAQWKNFEGAPVTQSIAFHGMLNKRMGFGFSLMSDKIGPIETQGIQLAYAHHIDMDFVNISFGLAGNMYQYGLNGNEITLQQNNDPAVLLEMSEKVWRPDVTFGTFIYNQRFYLGFSIMQLLGSTVNLYKDMSYTGQYPLVRHYYLNAGFNFSPIRNFDFEPSFLWTNTKGSPGQVELNFYMQYLQKILLGFSFRTKDAIVVAAGVKIKQKLKLAYSYDIVVSPLRNYESGSHELILSFIIPSSLGKWNRWRHEYQYDYNPKTHKWKERW